MGGIASLFAMIACMTSAQLMYKFAGNSLTGAESLTAALIVNPWVWSGLFLSGLGLMFWLSTLKRMPLSRAYPWTALIYALTPIASAFVFDESLSLKYAMGASLIVVGLAITNTAGQRN